MYKEEITSILRYLFQKMEEEGMFPNSLYEASLTSYINYQRQYKKKKTADQYLPWT